MAHRSSSSWLGKLLVRGLGVAVLLIASGILSSPLQFAAAPVEAQPSTFLYVNPPSQNVKLGSTAGVDVVIYNVANLYGAEVHLAFDPARLLVVDADPSRTGTQIDLGPLLTSGDYFVAVNRADNTLGTIDLALTQLNPTLPVTGTGAVAHIDFQARAVGTSTIRLASAMLCDRNGMTILFATNTQSNAATRARSPSNSTIQDGVISVTTDTYFLFVPFVIK